jgi:hypothetical protein
MITSNSAHAGMAGIGNAAVNKGQFTAHTRFSFSEDNENAAFDDQWRSRLMLDYGLTDDAAMGIYLQGDGDEVDAWMADARFELTEAATHGFYSGFRLRYTYKDGDKKPDNAHIRLIAGVPVNQWDFRINQIFAYQVGEGRRGGMGVDTRLQATYRYHPDHRAGIETLSDFGYGSSRTGFDRQNHVAGPVLSGKITDGLFYETGYRYGVSEAAPDHTFRLFITRVF